jgi:hypothetical protein
MTQSPRQTVGGCRRLPPSASADSLLSMADFCTGVSAPLRVPKEPPHSCGGWRMQCECSRRKRLSHSPFILRTTGMSCLLTPLPAVQKSAMAFERDWAIVFAIPAGVGNDDGMTLGAPTSSSARRMPGQRQSHKWRAVDTPFPSQGGPWRSRARPRWARRRPRRHGECRANERATNGEPLTPHSQAKEDLGVPGRACTPDCPLIPRYPGRDP